MTMGSRARQSAELSPRSDSSLSLGLTARSDGDLLARCAELSQLFVDHRENDLRVAAVVVVPDELPHLRDVRPLNRPGVSGDFLV